jgi:hypothetical protein
LEPGSKLLNRFSHDLPGASFSGVADAIDPGPQRFHQLLDQGVRRWCSFKRDSSSSTLASQFNQTTIFGAISTGPKIGPPKFVAGVELEYRVDAAEERDLPPIAKTNHYHDSVHRALAAQGHVAGFAQQVLTIMFM